jgi:hypothetical protein
MIVHSVWGVNSWRYRGRWLGRPAATIKTAARHRERMTGMFHHVVLLRPLPPIADIAVCDFDVPGGR